MERISTSRISNAFHRYGLTGCFSIIFQRVSKLYYIYKNRCYLRIKGIPFGKNLQIYNNLFFKISHNGRLLIGNNVKITSGGGINPLCRNICGEICVEDNALIKIGDGSGLSSACIWAKDSITIGKNVKIGGDCILIDSDAHSLDYRIRNGYILDGFGRIADSKNAVSAPIRICDDVLIGVRCIILKGVTIGERSIIAAGSIVTKSIPADVIAGGNPCRVIRKINL